MTFHAEDSKLILKKSPNTYLASLRIRFISPRTAHDSSIIKIESFFMDRIGRPFTL